MPCRTKEDGQAGASGVRDKAITMIGIAAVFGAVSIFAADLWLKSEASQRVETGRDRGSGAGRTQGRIQDHRRGDRSRCASACSSTAPNSPKSSGRRSPLPQGAFTDGRCVARRRHRVVLSPMEINEPVLLAKLSGPNGRATLSNLLSPGMRAVTIKTDEIAGVGGFVTPGDRVDIVLTRDAGAIEEVPENAAGAAGSTIATRDRRRECQGADRRAGRRRAPDRPRRSRIP